MSTDRTSSDETGTGSTAGDGVRIRAHPALCEGWGNCRRFGGSMFLLDDEGYIDIHLLDVPPEHAHAARHGADACPARAITVVELRRR